MMNRRHFLTTVLGATSATALPWATAWAGVPWTAARAGDVPPEKLLVMVYLKGGNDGYNTLAPFADPRYRRMRPNLALRREELLLINERQGLHPALKPLLPLLERRELAIVQGIGQQDVTNQHYRDAETQFTGASPDEYFSDGWMTRALVRNAARQRPQLDALAFGDLDIREADPMGPFRGDKIGVLNIAYPGEWIERRRLSSVASLANRKARPYDLVLEAPRTFSTAFPTDSFGHALRATAELAAAGLAPPIVHITLNAEDGDHHHAFDTHWDQRQYHDAALSRLAGGLSAFRAALHEIGRWQDTLIFTYDEFGRSPKENDKRGTHHGWANVQFLLGGRVKGGLHGEPMPLIDVFQIDGPPPTIDYRALYTTVIETFWQGSAEGVFAKRFKPLDLLHI